MPLNYSKWDAIELSDESDIEVHPNVDKKSFIRWKQRDIHEKRDERKARLAGLRTEIEMNEHILPQLTSYVAATRSEGPAFLSRTAAELKASTDDSKPSGSTGPSYREMMLSLLEQLPGEVKDVAGEQERVAKLVAKLEQHRDNMILRTEECRGLVAEDEAEQKKHITSDDLKVGFDTGHISANVKSAQPTATPVLKSADKGKGKAQTIEVLNPGSVKHASLEAPSEGGNASDSEADAEDIPALSSEAASFSKIPSSNWELLYKAISQAPVLLAESTVDALFMEAFQQAPKGPTGEKYARQCIHHALLLQYCTKLGADGVSLFFKRMRDNTKGREVFEQDVKTTADRIVSRAKQLDQEKEEDAGQETIQLVATEEGTSISFNVPDGPPPEKLVLEGEGTEELDVEEVRQFLQAQWDAYESFPKNLKKALKANDLEAVNKVLAKMALDEAEEVVGKLQEARILSFSQSGIVDQTAAPSEVE